MARISIVKVIEMENKETVMVAAALEKVLAGGMLDEETLYALAGIESDEGRAALIEGAARITAEFSPRKFDFCSIINARRIASGVPSRLISAPGVRNTGWSTPRNRFVRRS